jgi:superfamily II DNA helicase RecQ
VEQGYTLVVSPLLALMEDQARRIEGAVWFQAGLQEEDYRDLFEQLYERGIGFISPELLQSRTFKRLFEQEHPPTRLVIDEAHCVVRWGESFRPDYIQLGEFRRWLEESTGYDVPLATLTATLTEEEQAQLIEILSLRSPVCIRANPMRPELLYETRVIKSEKARYRELLKHLRDTPHTTGIVYVAFATGERHHSAQHLAEELNAQGFDVEPYYSRMSDARKKEVVQRLRARELQAIIATSAFGMGIDIPCMDWVIHLHPPTNLSEYYQGAGRAGRGMDHRIEQARCILMGHHNDWNMLKQHLYLSLLREDTLRDKLARFSDPHSATISGVHFDANKGVLMINPQMAPGHASHMLFAQRHGALERCASTSLPDGWLGWRLPATEDALLHFRKEREALKEEVNRHWMNMMQYLESDSPM